MRRWEAQMPNEPLADLRRSFSTMAAAGAVAVATVNPLATSAVEEEPQAGKKTRVALASSLVEQVNTFAVGTMRLATITGSMPTGFQGLRRPTPLRCACRVTSLTGSMPRRHKWHRPPSTNFCRSCWFVRRHFAMHSLPQIQG